MRDPGRERINRDDPVGVQVLLFKVFPFGAVHHQPPQVHFNLSGQDNLRAGGQPAGKPGLIEPRDAQYTGAIVQNRFGDLAFSAMQAAVVHTLDGGKDGYHFTD